jgi:hypothetical protein
MKAQLYESNKSLLDYARQHAIHAAGFNSPFWVTLIGPNGLLVHVRYDSLDDAGTPRIQHDPEIEISMLLPLEIAVTCDDREPLRGRVTWDKGNQRNKFEWQ